MSGFVWFCLVLFGFVWFCLVLLGLVRFCLVLFGFVWFCLVLFGFVWFCLVLLGFVRFCWALFGFLFLSFLRSLRGRPSLRGGHRASLRGASSGLRALPCARPRRTPESAGESLLGAQKILGRVLGLRWRTPGCHHHDGRKFHDGTSASASASGA